MTSGPPSYSAVATNRTKARVGNGTASSVVSAGPGLNVPVAADFIAGTVRNWSPTIDCIATCVVVALPINVSATAYM